MDILDDWTASPTCKVCGHESLTGSYLCARCRHLLDRMDTRKDAVGKGRTVDKAARRKALVEQWDSDIDGFRCRYTGIKLTHEFGSRRYATWEHRDPGDESSVVLVADLVNKMKGNMSEAEFRTMVRALARHFDDEPFDETAFPPDREPSDVEVNPLDR